MNGTITMNCGTQYEFRNGRFHKHGLIAEFRVSPDGEWQEETGLFLDKYTSENVFPHNKLNPWYIVDLKING